MRVHFAWFAWAVTVIAGFLISVDNHLRDRQESATPQYWPESVVATGNLQQPVLLMFMHPFCPCSKASLVELKELLDQSEAVVKVRILFFDSGHFTKDICKSTLWQTAQMIPGVAVERDLNGVMARHFCASASGSVVVYDAAGRLKFSGGITAGRGHVGENPGLAAIAAILNGECTKDRSYCVFGCPILSQSCGGEEAVR